MSASDAKTESKSGTESRSRTFEQWLGDIGFADRVARFSPRYREVRGFPSGGVEPSKEARDAAWELHVELRTRITTQELPLHSGNERAALTSLYDLFERTRKTLVKHGPDTACIAGPIMDALNEDVRPITAYWHGAVGEGRLSMPDEAGSFRADLMALQVQLRQLCDFLGHVACGKDYSSPWPKPEPAPGDTPTGTSPTTTTAEPAPRAAEPAKPAEPADPAEPDSAHGLKTLFESEEKSRKERRKCFEPKGLGDAALTGLALSGGGIRSATFALGVLSALSRAGMYRSFDYLSTVSGGGYLGTLISTWATAKEKAAGGSEKLSPEEKKRLAEGPFSDEATVAHLRDRSRYLVSGGPLELARAAVFITLGILASIAGILLTTPIPLALTWAVHWAIAAFGGYASFALAAFIAGALILTRIPAARASLGRGVGYLILFPLVMGAPALAIWAFKSLLTGFENLLGLAHGLNLPAAALVALIPLVLKGISRLLEQRRATLRAAWVLLAVSPWVAYAGLLTLIWRALPDVGKSHFDISVFTDARMIVYGLVLLVAALFVVATDVNESSPRGYYRDRLAETYCVDLQDRELLPAQKVPKFRELTDLAPIHLVNATVNLPSTRARNNRGRGAAPFVFSKHGWTYPKSEADALVTAFKDPSQDKFPEEDVANAMAISGAAVSPFLGTLTPTGASPWLTLFNLRLSYWLPNPGKPGWSLPWGKYQLYELLGNVDENGTRLNLSDGGHFENLGVYELIRRRCRYIVAIDGSADSGLGCGELMKLMRLARIDFGADILIDIRKLRVSEEKLSRAHLAVGDIHYHGGGKGTLIYVKLSVTGDEPAHLQAYRERESIFPHHSTADQLFTEEQFEAYRALGQHIGESLFRDELVGAELARAARVRRENPDMPPVPLPDWVNAIRTALHREKPPAHRPA
jgi:hypothetical protein